MSELDEIRRHLTELKGRLARGEVGREDYDELKRELLAGLSVEERAAIEGAATPTPTPRRLGPSPVRTKVPRRESAEVEPGEFLFDRWRIIREIGRGGFATVYEAEDVVLGGRVALKVLSPALVEREEGLARFRREMSLMRQLLTHPNIVHVYDYREDLERSLAAFSMEVVEGCTLLEVIGEARRAGRMLPTEQAVGIVRQVLDALGVAHAKGIIHRDVSPKNVMLEGATADQVVRGEAGPPVVRVADFGIAGLVDRESLTKQSMVLGTAAYVAPEVLSGERADERSDLYGVGALLCELLTLKVPQGRLTPVGATRPDDGWLDPIIDRAMAQEPRERHQSAEEFAGALEPPSEPPPPPLPKPPPPPPPRQPAGQPKPAENMRTAKLWLGLAAVVVGLGAILAIWKWTARPGENRPEQVEPVVEMVERLEVEPPSLTLHRRDIVEPLTVKAYDAKGNQVAAPMVTWASSDEGVVKADAAGRVTPVGSGEAMVVAAAGNARAEVPVTVALYERIALSDTVLLMEAGERKRMTARLMDERGHVIESEVRWESGNRGIAEVDAGGQVTAKAVGMTEVLARAEGIESRAGVRVFPNPPPPPAVPDIELDRTSVEFTVRVGEKASKPLTITNRGPGKLEVGRLWTDATWLSAAVGTSSGANTPVTVSADASGKSAGTYSGIVTISSNDPDEREVRVGVTMVVQEPPGPRAGEERVTTLAGGAKLSMVWIPPGSFTMGSPETEAGRDSDEGPQHQVTIGKGCWMGATEVTQEQYQAVMGTNPSQSRGTKRPVEQASWNDAVEFCKKLSQREGLTPCYSGSGSSITCNWNANGYRLPTEAEWEYACRAGTTGPFHTGSCLSTSEANYDGNRPYSGCSKGPYRQTTWDVGSGAKNAWGLYDMHGNVWEWCWDWYGDYSSGSQTDPRGPSTGSVRVNRGGCWYYFARYCRSADRGGDGPGGRDDGSGFRVVRAPGQR